MLETINLHMSKYFSFLILSSLLLAPLMTEATTDTIEANIQNVLYIECGGFENDVWTPVITGSGVVVDNDYVLTNAHVVADTATGIYYAACRAGYVRTASETPVLTIYLNPLYGRYDEYFDYALMEPINEYGGIVSFTSHANLSNADSLVLNDDLYVLGYPSIGGSTVTATAGSITGFLGGNWIKSDVAIEHGNSGGGAFDVYGNFLGIPTAVVQGEIGNLTYIQNINAVLEDIFGTAYVTRDYTTQYTPDNIFCFEDFCYNIADDENENIELFNGISEDESVDPTTLNDDSAIVIDPDAAVEPVTEEAPVEDAVTQEVSVPLPPEAGKYNPSHFDAKLQARLKGSILLQVEEHGEAWYVNPNDSLRYYMANGAVAYQMMRSFSLGISDTDLTGIPAVADTTAMNTAKSVCKTNKLANRLRGYILLQTEQHGEAWYVDPDTCNRIYMKDGDVAYEIMRYLSLGIINTDLEKLPSGQIE